MSEINIEMNSNELSEQYLESIWWLDHHYNIPMDIIRMIMEDWIIYEPIENNEMFKELLEIWLDKKNKRLEEKKIVIYKYGHISDWNTKNITDMSEAFLNNKEFSEDLSRWDVSNVKNMSSMFANCHIFSCDLSQWNVKHVQNMHSMFSDCHHFISNLSQWKVSQVKDMSYMFYSCLQFNSDLSQWNVSHVTNMKSMFENCQHFTCNISMWNIRRVNYMYCIFDDCLHLLVIDEIYKHWKQINPNIRF